MQEVVIITDVKAIQTDTVYIYKERQEGAAAAGAAGQQQGDDFGSDLDLSDVSEYDYEGGPQGDGRQSGHDGSGHGHEGSGYAAGSGPTGTSAARTHQGSSRRDGEDANDRRRDDAHVSTGSGEKRSKEKSRGRDRERSHKVQSC